MLAIIALILCGMSLLFNIIGMAIPYWLTHSDYHGFLWKTCKGDICLSISSDGLPSGVAGARALEVIAMLLMIGAVVCALLKMYVMKEQALFPKIAGGLAIVAGIFMIIGCISFVSTDGIKRLMDVGASLGAGFGLCILAGLLGIPGGVLFLRMPAE